MKHKHAELIKQWADGAEIQLQEYNGSWHGTDSPQWRMDSAYRIKPEPRPQWQQDLIDAAKAGKVVEFYDAIAGWVESDLNKQLDLYNFGYATQSDFRIRPTKVTRYLWAVNKGDGWDLNPFFILETDNPYYSQKYPIKRLDWSATEFEE